MSIRFYLFQLFLLTWFIFGINARIHHLNLQGDQRKYVKISSFGFSILGSIRVNVEKISTQPTVKTGEIGFSLLRTMTDGLHPFAKDNLRCILEEREKSAILDEGIGLVTIILDFERKKAIFHCDPSMAQFRILPGYYENQAFSQRKRAVAELASVNESVPIQDPADGIKPEEDVCGKVDLIENKPQDPSNPSYSLQFHTKFYQDSLVGLYSLYLHTCPNYDLQRPPTKVSLSISIEEKNLNTYLSAGEMLLPQLFFIFSVIHFILGFVWFRIIRSRKEDSFKIHYLMGALVFVKALALFFHFVDYHYISRVGMQNETWAILYYTTHFLKGALLFITIALIGTGWAFIKHILSDKDKKVFMIVIPLQVLANVAEIFTEESEEGQFMHNIWRTIFLLVDLLCCGAILFPIVWSIRHLQEASTTDGKAAINLVKLRLFRRFYVMIVCYIYFTRIIIFILQLVLPFQYQWVDTFCQHTATLLFFISTGYYFQPTRSNPYFQLALQEDLELEEVLFNATPNVYFASGTKKRTVIEANNDNQESGDEQRLISKRDSQSFE